MYVYVYVYLCIYAGESRDGAKSVWGDQVQRVNNAQPQQQGTELTTEPPRPQFS